MLSKNQLDNLRICLNKYAKATLKKENEKKIEIENRVRTLYGVENIQEAVKLYKNNKDKELA